MWISFKQIGPITLTVKNSVKRGGFVDMINIKKNSMKTNLEKGMFGCSLFWPIEIKMINYAHLYKPITNINIHIFSFFVIKYSFIKNFYFKK